MQKNLEYDVEFTFHAREDIREIVLWYRNEVEGLEDRFLISLKSSIDLIARNPTNYQVNFGVIRSILLNRFPYRVYYFIEEKVIKILAVIHLKRSPRYIRKRLK
ncbi:MAG: type II toxin-antitoxin system RelE/ParE family toxin [Cyclobacteriaceae bacterium]|nr:type II toxin-antitoxin system RelE/ParE family toxin [Cyclobacteriaceae bacterium]